MIILKQFYKKIIILTCFGALLCLLYYIYLAFLANNVKYFDVQLGICSLMFFCFYMYSFSCKIMA